MITTIGKDLIKDIPTSIVELVKNSYDADAEKVNITFSKFIEGDDPRIEIIIQDNGHGMTFDTIVDSWLVPATSNKVNQKLSRSKKRTLQGKKGIGRYAAAILGNYMQLETVSDNQKTIAYINWDDFEIVRYLDEIGIEVEVEDVDQPNGTLIRVLGNAEYYNLWTEKEIRNLIKELRKLLSPFHHNNNDDLFEITFEVIDFLDDSNEFKNFRTIIEPLPIVDMYNYRLYGTINNEGIADLVYINNSLETQQSENIPPFKINLENDEGKYCGRLELDLRVFDFDNASVTMLQQKLKAIDLSFHLREVTKEVKELSGVGIYRGGFRVRPHGDKGFDWLHLDSRRVQNPSMRIGQDQIIGYISIEPEEYSNLEEKSSRDGLKETSYYEGLRNLTRIALKQLEERRFLHRRNIDKSKQKTIYQKLESLFDFSDLQITVEKTIDGKLDEVSKGKDKKIVAEDIMKVLNRSIDAIKKEKEKEYEEIKQLVALYQGQATLGSITTIVLHEGRKHVSWYSNTLPRVVKWLNEFRVNQDENLLSKSILRLKDTDEETRSLIALFDKLDPLTIKANEKIKDFKLLEIVDYVEQVFKNELENNNIKIIRQFESEEIIYRGFEQDFRRSFLNFMENSIYWLKRDIDNKDKFIKFSVEYTEENLIIDIIDNGIGISKQFIESELIFNPGFSTKESGTGLGLAIAGEAIRRNNGTLKALYSTEGTHLRIELRREADE